MTLTMAPLFTLSVTHEFYGGVCPDLSFSLPETTSRLMRGASLLAKSRPGSLLVLAASEGGAPLGQLTGRTLRFGLRIDNPLFGNITEGLDPKAGALVYRNTSPPGALSKATAMPLVGRSLRHVPSQSSRPVTIQVNRPAGVVLPSQKAILGPGQADVTFDLSLADPGELRIDETYSSSSATRRSYLDPEIAAQGALGVIEITMSEGFLSSPPTFTIPFSARRDTLKYYVVTNYANGDLAKLSVADQGFSEQGRPEIKFSRAPSLGPRDIPAALLTRDPARKVVLFASNTPVPRAQAGRKGIKLLRATEALIEHLPQPGAGKAAADVIIHLSKP